MSSSFVADTTDDSSNAGNTVIIIVNDDTGNVSVDQEMLQLLASQENTTLSVVRVNDMDSENSTDVNMTVEEIYNPGTGPLTEDESASQEPTVEEVKDTEIMEPRVSEQGIEPTDPLLNLDQEEIEKIAHALQEDQAGHLFGSILPQEAGLDDLLDPELTGDPDVADPVTTVSLDHCYSITSTTAPVDEQGQFTDASGANINLSPVKSATTLGGARSVMSPKRRSQRQIDRQEMEQLKKIRAENEELLKKEKEKMHQALQPIAPKTEEPNIEPDTLSLDSNVPVEPVITQPVSRLSAIRQELQQKILAVDPIKPKVPAPSPSLTKLVGSRPATPKVQTAKPAEPTSVPKEANLVLNKMTPPQNIAPKTPSDSGSTPPSRPRRENRQPPKHLREAFNQLEFENVEKSVKRISRNPASLSGAENSSQESEDEGTANDTLNESEEAENDDEFGEDSDEEDPKKLWCICRKPHGNRFMICCDKCEDWFHGNCVGVTRAIGRELVRKGLDWICPKCVRLMYANRSPPISAEDLGIASGDDATGSVSANDPPIPDAAQDAEKAQSRKQQQPNSKRARTESTNSATDETTATRRDACIVAHARDSLIAMSKEKTKQIQQQQQIDASSPTVTTSTAAAPVITTGAAKWKESLEFGALMSQPTPPSAKSKAVNNSRKSSEGVPRPANLTDDTPVPVMERKTGKILTGSSAPKVGNLEQWLKDNPTYEIIKPATLPKANKPRPLTLVSPSVSSVALSAKSPITPTTSSPVSSSASKAKAVPARKASESLTPTSSTRPKVVRKRSLESARDDDTPKKAQPAPETTRASAKSSLKDALWNRCKDASDIQSDEKAVEQLADEIEEALYSLFNKDVGTKYKSRYRSLIFNIKDPKNLGLFRKIVERQFTPGQLVKMTAEELASKELAEWREREAKHQLEIIQKTEMELMTMSNKYLVKTHKGEEIIEEAGKDLEDRDLAPSTTVAPPSILEALQDTTSKHKSHVFDLNCRICTKQVKEDELEKSDVKESKEKSKERSHSSRSSSRKADEKSSGKGSSSHHSSSTETKKHSSSSDKSKRDRHDSKESRHRESDRKSRDSKDRNRKDSKERRHHSKDRHRHSSSGKHRSDRDKERSKREGDGKKEVKKEDAKKEDIPTTTSETTPLPQDVAMNQDVSKSTDTVKETDSEALALPVSDDSQTKPQEVASKIVKEEEPLVKQEPTSTVTVKTPEQSSPVIEPGLSVVWKGVINSTDTGKVTVHALDLCGSSDFTDIEMPSSLDIVGRIRPEMVWDYVNQTRKVGSREIVVFKFIPSTDGDRKNYSAFLSHMCKANRFAVVGPVSKLIKDFYIVPLPKDSPIPSALSVLAQQKSLDENRTSSLLLGVVVRARKKRAADPSGSSAVPSKMPKSARVPRRAPSSTGSNSPSLSYIPSTRSSSSAAKKAESTKKAFDSTASAKEADDAPYSPGQLLNEEDQQQPVSDDAAIKQKAMLEELNRQIEAQKQELATLSKEIPADVTIPGLGEPVIPGLGDPAVPPTNTSWDSGDSKEPRVTPSTDPPFEHSSKPASDPLNLNLSNLQDIISTIQKKEMEMKMLKAKMSETPAMRPIMPNELYSPHDVDMRIAPIIPPPIRPPITQHMPATMNSPIGQHVPTADDKKKPSLLNQLTDEELLAKAMEMEMEQSGMGPSPAPAAVAAPPPNQGFYSPPRGPGPYGGHPMGPRPPMMMGPGPGPGPRPFHSPPYMAPRGPPFRSPPMQGGFRGRNKKKR